MQGVFNISPASIIFKKQRSEIFEQFSLHLEKLCAFESMIGLITVEIKN